MKQYSYKHPHKQLIDDEHTLSSTKANRIGRVIHILNSTCLLYLKIPVETHNKLLLFPDNTEKADCINYEDNS